MKEKKEASSSELSGTVAHCAFLVIPANVHLFRDTVEKLKENPNHQL